MKASGSNFELIMQEVLKQKQLLEDLQTENVELHRQLAELRQGQVFLLISLVTAFRWLRKQSVYSPSAVATGSADLSLQETTEMLNKDLPSSTPETPVPALELDIEEGQEDLPIYETPTMSSYLEEAMIDEFSTATTQEIGQVAVWSGPITNP